jgi:hypothetical protein
MKTLEMLLKAEMNRKVYNKEGLYYSKERGFTDAHGTPWKGYAFSTINDLIHDEGHYSDDWKEVFKVSDDEKVILRNLKGKWLARNEFGILLCYSIKPYRISKYWHHNHATEFSLKAFNHLFQMVQWEDEEPTLIADLLREV